MAYRLMMKYDIDAGSLHDLDGQHGGDRGAGVNAVERRRYETTGPFRVRRYFPRYGILEALSCAVFRASNEEHLDADANAVICYAFGTKGDLDSAEALYVAAELLAQRTTPWGTVGIERCGRAGSLRDCARNCAKNVASPNGSSAVPPLFYASDKIGPKPRCVTSNRTPCSVRRAR